MTGRSRITTTVLTALTAVAAGCASAGGRSAAEEVVWVRVANDAVPATAVTVYAVEEDGDRKMLGRIQPSATVTFPFEPPTEDASYHLAAQSAGGEPIVSRPFTLGEADVVLWSVEQNVVKVGNSGS